MRINNFILFMTVTLLISGSAALAYKDVTSGSIKPTSRQTATKQKQDKPTLRLKVPDPQTKENKKGVELKIPGIGRIGTLPKLDFGLELLYGTKNEELPEENDNTEGITIKGSIKHNF